jgi:hypothetical protein
MQITCSDCSYVITISEDKVPKDKAFMLSCPACTTKIRVDQHLSVEEEKSSTESPSSWEEVGNTPVKQPEADFDEEDEDEDLRIYDENDQIALVLDERNKIAWTKTLSEFHPSWGELNVSLAQEEGYKIEFAKSPGHAVHKLKFTQFNFIALADNYGDVSLSKNLVYRHILELPMAFRRKVFVVLIGDHFKTMNQMQAFSYSVNVVINNQDVGKLHQIIKKSLRDNEVFYKAFRDSLAAHGKA